MARSLSSAAAAEKAEGLRRDLLLRLYGRVLEAPGLTLRDTFTYIVDTLYKVGRCGAMCAECDDEGAGAAQRMRAATAPRLSCVSAGCKL